MTTIFASVAFLCLSVYVVLTIVFEDGQYYNEQIKLGFRTNEILFRFYVQCVQFQFTWLVSIVVALSVATNFEIVLLLIQ